jgi:hypothetical protein
MRFAWTGALTGIVLVSVGCAQHPAPRPTGTAFYTDAPTGVVSALPDNVVRLALLEAERCEAGSFDACARLAFHYEHGLEPASAKGGGHGDEEEGHGHGHHAGPPESALSADAPRALALYQSACGVGFRASCLAAASLLRDGAGVQHSPETAAALVRSACLETSYIDACLLHAATTTSTSERARILHRTCHLGEATACIEAAPHRF